MIDLSKTSIRTIGGNIFDFEDILSNTIDINDCLIPLSNICRFGGHTNTFYSVLNHSLECYKFLVNEGFKDELVLLHVLIHDFTEAFCGDMVKPLKIGLKDYNDIEEQIRIVVFKHFGISEQEYLDTHEEVKFADNVLVANELHQIKGETDDWIMEIVDKHYHYVDVVSMVDKFVLIEDVRGLVSDLMREREQRKAKK